MTVIASVIERSEVVPGFDEFGIRAFTTTRAVGSFGLLGTEPVGVVYARWNELRGELRNGAAHGRLATAGQVHGANVLVHRPGWSGWLRAESADGHVSLDRGT